MQGQGPRFIPFLCFSCQFGCKGYFCSISACCRGIASKHTSMLSRSKPYLQPKVSLQVEVQLIRALSATNCFWLEAVDMHMLSVLLVPRHATWLEGKRMVFGQSLHVWQQCNVFEKAATKIIPPAIDTLASQPATPGQFCMACLCKVFGLSKQPTKLVLERGERRWNQLQ